MLTNPVPSLQAIVVAHLSPDILYHLGVSLVLPKLPTLKERINIRVLGTHNPIKIVTYEELQKELYKRSDKRFGYIHPASSDFGNQSPRTKRLNKLPPEKRKILGDNVMYTKVDFYDYYYYDPKLAQTKWKEAEERIDPEGSYQTYTKHQFYDYYQNKEIAELKWVCAIEVEYRDGYNYIRRHEYDHMNDII